MRKLILGFLMALSLSITADNYQTLFNLKDNPDNVRKINDTFYSLNTGKQNKVFDIWTTTPTINDIQNGNVVAFYSDDTGRLIYKVNEHIYFVQGTFVE